MPHERRLLDVPSRLAAGARAVRARRTVTLLSAALVALVSPWFLLLTAFAGVNQWLYVATGACPASLVLTRLFGLRAAADTPPTSQPG